MKMFIFPQLHCGVRFHVQVVDHVVLWMQWVQMPSTSRTFFWAQQKMQRWEDLYSWNIEMGHYHFFYCYVIVRLYFMSHPKVLIHIQSSHCPPIMSQRPLSQKPFNTTYLVSQEWVELCYNR